MEEQGPFDGILRTEPRQRRDRAAYIIVATSIALGLLLLILVLPPISILHGGGNPAAIGPISSEVRGDLPAPPDGFEAVSALFDLSANEPVAPSAHPRLTVSLAVQVSQGEQLSLFTYRDGSWRRLGNATALADGTAAQGEVPLLPGNVAVFRPAERVRLVLGSLPLGAGLDPSTLSAITTLNPMGYGPAPDGQVSGGPVDLPEGLTVNVAPTIKASSPSEIEALSAILASPDLRAAHVRSILDLVHKNAFAGVDLDYRAIEPSHGDEFTSFVQELSPRLRAEGLSLSLTLPLPVRTGDKWDTLGFDWGTLAPLVDAIKLPNEAGQDRYYERMEAALTYLVPDRVPSGKLLLTVGPLSHERGVDGERTLSMSEALSLASIPVLQGESPVAPESVVEALGQNVAAEMGASGLRWDEAARAVVFKYTGGGGERTVWLANMFSETFKLDLARRYQLGGVAVEDASLEREDANIWPAVVRYAQTGEVNLVKPNAELLSPRWTVSGGTLAGDTGSLVRWTVPAEEGTYTITLIVSDGVTRVGQELQVPVAPREGAAPPS